MSGRQHSCGTWFCQCGWWFEPSIDAYVALQATTPLLSPCYAMRRS